MHAFYTRHSNIFKVSGKSAAFAWRAASFAGNTAKQKGYKKIKTSHFKNYIHHLFYIKVR